MLILGQCSNIGDEWLVTDNDTESYIPDVTEVCMVHTEQITLTTYTIHDVTTITNKYCRKSLKW